MRILITGAAGAIGGRTAAILRAQGHRVMGIDRLAGDDIITADLCDDGQSRAAVGEAVGRLGGLDVLLNNVGRAHVQDTGFAAAPGVRATVDLNLLAAWQVTAAALPALLESRGRVVNIASVLAYLNLPFLAAYCTSKRAMTALSDILRVEYAGSLSVVTVYPGYIKTPFHDIGLENGLSLAGVVPEESLEHAAMVIAKACGGRARRDVATSFIGMLAIWTARFSPGLLDALVVRRLRRLAAGGKLAGAEVAAPMVRRLTARDGSGRYRGELARDAKSNPTR